MCHKQLNNRFNCSNLGLNLRHFWVEDLVYEKRTGDDALLYIYNVRNLDSKCCRFRITILTVTGRNSVEVRYYLYENKT